MIHDIDLTDTKYDRAETAGFNALLTGLAASQPDDDQRMTLGLLQKFHFPIHYLVPIGAIAGVVWRMVVLHPTGDPEDMKNMVGALKAAL